MTVATIVLHIVTLGWGVLMGAVIYEHVAVVPVWAAHPPASLAMWRGEHRIRAERFWMGVHPLLLLAFIATAALNWSTVELRNGVLITVAGYVVVLLVTALYYVPELMRLTGTADGGIPNVEWGRRARRWELLSILRGVFMLGLSWPLLRALAATWSSARPRRHGCTDRQRARLERLHGRGSRLSSGPVRTGLRRHGRRQARGQRRAERDNG